MRIEILLVVLGAGIATYLTRFPLLILSEKWEIPGRLVKFMNYIAPAILTALIAPVIFLKQGELDATLSNEYFIATIVTCAAAYFSKNMLVSVIAGIGTVGLLTYFIK